MIYVIAMLLGCDHPIICVLEFALSLEVGDVSHLLAKYSAQPDVLYGAPAPFAHCSMHSVPNPRLAPHYPSPLSSFTPGLAGLRQESEKATAAAWRAEPPSFLYL